MEEEKGLQMTINDILAQTQALLSGLVTCGIITPVEKDGFIALQTVKCSRAIELWGSNPTQDQVTEAYKLNE